MVLQNVSVGEGGQGVGGDEANEGEGAQDVNFVESVRQGLVADDEGWRLPEEELERAAAKEGVGKAGDGLGQE